MVINDKCPACGRTRHRTHPMNARYFALLRKAAEAMGHEVEHIHIWFKRKYLPMKEIELPDWSVILVPISTSKMKIKEFSDYVMKVEVFLAEQGITLDE